VKLMVGYFYHLDYLRDDNAAAASALIEVEDSPAPPKNKGKKSTPAKKARASTSAPTEAALPPSLNVHLIEHAKVFAMAVKYRIAALQNLAAQKFQAEVIEHWNHEDVAHAIHVIYTSTAEDVTQLRKVAVEVLNAHRDELLLKPEITTLLRSITGLACDLLLRDFSSITGRHLAEDWPLLCCMYPSGHSDMRCPSCGCDLHFCAGCTGFQLSCPACGEEL
jgi:hypothetical protein